MVLNSKWKELSQDADSTGTILSLIWTDIMTSATVGTKLWGVQDRPQLVTH